MTHNYDYDFFVIGGGSGGVRAARIAATHGAKVGLAEGRDLGGTCVNVGCVPKKLFVYASEYSHSAEDAEGYGWNFEKPTFDWKTLIKNKDKEIERLNGIYEKILGAANVEIFSDYAAFVDEHTLQVGNQKITADKILIAVGGKPRKPAFEGGDFAVTSDDMFHLEKLPKRMIVQGAGYIGVEFAHIMNNFGVEVTLVYRGDSILKGFDDDIRDFALEEMQKKGINVLLNTNIEKAEKIDSNLLVHLTNGETIETDLILAAIGRESNLEQLSLNNTNVQIDKRNKIEINEQFETSVPHIYAVGDVTDNVALTPVALGEGHMLADRLFSQDKKHKVNFNMIPKAVFSQPPIATVGLGENQAKESGYDIDIYKSSFGPMAYTLSKRNENSLMKIIVDKKSDIVLGLHMCGKDSPEIMQGFAAALHMGIKKSQLDQVIGIHPTSAEEFVTMRTPVKG